MANDVRGTVLEPPRTRSDSSPAASTYLLSVAIPVYNERETLTTILERIRAVPVPMELILVDDGSTDGTRDLLKDEIEGRSDNVRVLYHAQNLGKGAAIVTAIAAAQGDFLIVQDADLEYDPADYPRLLAPLLAGEAQVVYGSRFLGRVEAMKPANLLANKLLTLTANILYPGARLTDEATCYKVFRMDLLRSFRLNARRFDFCPEVTAKVLKRGVKIVELPIAYRARTNAQGKKIRWTDGLDALWTLVKYRFTE
jgi:glycosyltransferase involved in cell wall biosynthesis